MNNGMSYVKIRELLAFLYHRKRDDASDRLVSLCLLFLGQEILHGPDLGLLRLLAGREGAIPAVRHPGQDRSAVSLS